MFQMYHDLPCNARFWELLETIDEDLAQCTRKQGCPCGGRLHGADYPRTPKPKDRPWPVSYFYRFSFCCARDGCRKRCTPPSVRFLGPKVYLHVVVLLVSALRQGPSPRGARELKNRFGADRRTIARWQTFWNDTFPQTAFWKAARARLTPGLPIGSLPRALLDAFLTHPDDPPNDWTRLLEFLSPITVPDGLRLSVSDVVI